MARLAAGPPPRRRRRARWRGATRGTSTAASTSSSRRAAACARTSPTGASSGVALPAARRRHRGRSIRIARDPGWRRRARLRATTRACSSTPAASRRRSTSTCSPTRSTRLGAAATCCSRSAPGRRRRRRSERVRVLPFVAGRASSPTVLASADAFVHAGDQETFGLSVLEAMACGTPVVVRRAEGLAELADGRCGRRSPSTARGAARSPRRSTPLFAGDRRRSAVPRVAARRGARLGAACCRRCSATTARLLGDARGAPAPPPGGRSRPRTPLAAMSAETTITPSRSRASAALCVVLHDVAPSTRAACVRDAAPRSPRSRRRAADPARRAALPRRGADARASSDWLGERRRRGDELALHGWTHRDDGAPRGLASTACGAAATRAARASSGRLSEREARARHRRRPRLVRARTAGRSPASSRRPGCSARAPGTRCASGRFEYTATLRHLVHLPGRRAADEPERRLQHARAHGAGSARCAGTRSSRRASATTRCCASSCIRATPTSPAVRRSWQRILERALRERTRRDRRRLHAPHRAAAPTLMPARSAVDARRRRRRVRPAGYSRLKLIAAVSAPISRADDHVARVVQRRGPRARPRAAA